MKRLAVILFLTLFCLFLSSNSFAQPKYIEQGINDYKAENYEEALESLIKARELEPVSTLAAFFLGLTYKQLQNFPEAKKHLTDAVTYTPKIKEALVELIEVQYQLNELNEALQRIEDAEALEVKSAQVAFLKGLILAKQGKNKEAVLAFTKAKELSPGLSSIVDYQLGLIDLKEGKLSKSKENFKKIIAQDPNSDLAAYARQYLEAVEKRQEETKPFTLSAGFKYEMDDNVILKPSDASVAAGISGKKDQREVLTLLTGYNFTGEGSPYSLKTQYSLYLTNQNHLETHNIQSHTISLIPSYSTQKSLLNLTAGYNYTLVKDEKYLNTFTLNPSYLFLLNSVHIAQVSLKYQNKDYLYTPLDTFENRDSNDYGGELSYIFLFKKGKGFFNIRYGLNKEITDGRNWEYLGNKLSANILYPFTDKFKFNVYGEFFNQDFSNVNTFFFKKRKDKTYTASASLSYEVYKKTDLIAQYTYIKDRSNTAVYAYKREIGSLGFEWRY